MPEAYIQGGALKTTHTRNVCSYCERILQRWRMRMLLSCHLFHASYFLRADVFVIETNVFSWTCFSCGSDPGYH